MHSAGAFICGLKGTELRVRGLFAGERVVSMMMKLSRVVRSRLWSKMTAIKSDIDDEFAFHIEQKRQKYINEGFGVKEADILARRDFGNAGRNTYFCLFIAFKDFIFVGVALVFLSVFLVHEYFVNTQPQWQRVSPFYASVWLDQSATVLIDEQWLELVSINGYSVNELIEKSKSEFGPRWKKRLNEDLYEVLALFGDVPSMNVLVVTRSDEARIGINILMSKERRLAAWRFSRNI